LAGMEINSAVELGGGRVILHGDHSIWGRETPVNAIGYAGSVVALPARLPMLTKITKGFQGSIKSLQATRDGALSSASRFALAGPACLSSGRWAHSHDLESLQKS
jgi:hypothetical protein